MTDSAIERRAMEKAMLTMDRDGRPGTWSRLAFEAGWNAAREFYAIKPDPNPVDPPMEINDGFGP